MAPASSPDPGNLDVASAVSILNDFWALFAAAFAAIVFFLKFIWNFSGYVRGIDARFEALHREIDALRVDARHEISSLRDLISEHRPNCPYAGEKP